MPGRRRINQQTQTPSTIGGRLEGFKEDPCELTEVLVEQRSSRLSEVTSKAKSPKVFTLQTENILKLSPRYSATSEEQVLAPRMVAVAPSRTMTVHQGTAEATVPQGCSLQKHSIWFPKRWSKFLRTSRPPVALVHPCPDGDAAAAERVNEVDLTVVKQGVHRAKVKVE